jgi:hypothetical protein
MSAAFLGDDVKLQFIGELPRPPVTKRVKGEALH